MKLVQKRPKSGRSRSPVQRVAIKTEQKQDSDKRESALVFSKRYYNTQGRDNNQSK